MTDSDAPKMTDFRPNPNLQINMVHSNKVKEDKCLMCVDEVEALKKLATRQRIIEIGSFRGGSAKEMLPLCISLICIDPHEDLWWYADKEKGESADIKGEDLHRDFMASIAPWKEKVTYLRKYSQDALQDIDMKSIDLLFVDGDHSFESCKRDLDLFVPRFHPKMVAVHDYCIAFPGVIAACQVHFKRNPNYLVNTLAIWKC